MHVAYHIGAHCTDDDRLIKSLLKNKGVLANEGVIVPGPGRYRNALGSVVNKLAGAKASPETQDMLLDSILDVDNAERLILGHANFLGVHSRVLESGEFYPVARDKVTRLRNLFPDSPVSFFIGLRNPATFLPALFELGDSDDFTAFLGQIDPRDLFWSDVIETIRDAAPDCPVTVWCNEDTPLIWSEIMTEIAGIEPGEVPLKGGLDIIAEIMAKGGMARLRAYLDTHTPQNEMHRRRILAAFLDKFAMEDAVEQELDLPGWTAELIDDLTAAYDDDLLEIAAMPGVTVLSP